MILKLSVALNQISNNDSLSATQQGHSNYITTDSFINVPTIHSGYGQGLTRWRWGILPQMRNAEGRSPRSWRRASWPYSACVRGTQAAPHCSPLPPAARLLRARSLYQQKESASIVLIHDSNYWLKTYNFFTKLEIPLDVTYCRSILILRENSIFD